MWPFKKQVETRAAISHNDPMFGQLIGASFAGTVDIGKASRMAIAARCITLISEAIASAELGIFRLNPAGGATLATDHNLYSLLMDEAYPGVSAFDMKERIASDILTWGNAYLRIHRNGRSQVTGLQPMAFGDVTVERLSTGRARYTWTNPAKSGEVIRLTEDEIVHFKYRSRDGIMGRSPISLAATSMGIAVAQEDAAGSAAENSFRPAGLITLPNAVEIPKLDAYRAAFKEKFLGASKANSLMVLDNGADWQSIQLSSADQQVLESRKWSAFDVCRAFGVLPSSVGLVEGATFNNSSEEARQTVQRTFKPFGKRIEQQLMTAIMSPETRRSYYLEHDWSEYMAGSIKERFEAYKIAREGGFYSVDDIRAKESMGRVPGGDGFIQPLNYAPLGSVAANGQHNTSQVSA